MLAVFAFRLLVGVGFAQEKVILDTDYTTIGGWVFGQLGRLPKVGDKVTSNGVTFEVAEMEGRRVKGVRLVEKKAVGR